MGYQIDRCCSYFQGLGRTFSILGLACLVVTHALAGDLERRQAKRIHDRLAGIPPSESVLDAMETAIVSGNAIGAAIMAMDNGAFYNVLINLPNIADAAYVSKTYGGASTAVRRVSAACDAIAAQVGANLEKQVTGKTT